MDEAIHYVATKLAARDLEHSGHQEPEDFYEDFAAIAIKAYEEYQYRPHEKHLFVEGVRYL